MGRQAVRTAVISLIGLRGKRKTAARRRTVWPWLSGWMSRKARTRSLSKSLKEGISPSHLSARLSQSAIGERFGSYDTFDDFAKDTGGHSCDCASLSRRRSMGENMIFTTVPPTLHI